MLKLMTFGLVAVAAGGLYLATPRQPAKVADPAAVKAGLRGLNTVVQTGAFVKVSYDAEVVAVPSLQFLRSTYDTKSMYAAALWQSAFQATGIDRVTLQDPYSGKEIGVITRAGLRMF